MSRILIVEVGIPDSVLLKPGALTEQEFKIMKTHTTIGARTLEAALAQYPDVQYLHFARDIALTHHERFDGDGYPNGLSEQKIPLSGRIVALADAYDVLRSARPYKMPYSHDRTRERILDERGKQFDPAVVDAFVATESDFVAAWERFVGTGAGDPTRAFCAPERAGECGGNRNPGDGATLPIPDNLPRIEEIE